MSGGGGGRIDVPNMLRIPVAVLAERRPGSTPWAEWSWRAVEVLEDAPGLPPWTVLREAEGRTLYFAGEAEVALAMDAARRVRAKPQNLAVGLPLVAPEDGA